MGSVLSSAFNLILYESTVWLNVKTIKITCYSFCLSQQDI